MQFLLLVLYSQEDPLVGQFTELSSPLEAYIVRVATGVVS